ncbi:MAG TPA: PIN domain-containing protein [Anaerolineae bacterium]|nr:PIN domain-containing protein [Anaerolineae bacterium]HQK15261.1 PIN domain-containing protein [Anaerolineae bacterium]
MQITLILRFIGLIVFGSVGVALAAQVVQIPAIPANIHIYITVFGGILGGVLGFIYMPQLTINPFKRFRHAVQHLPAEEIFSATIGLFLGLALGAISAYPISLLPQPLGQFLPFIVTAAFGYVGLMVTTIRPDLLQGLRARLFPKESRVSLEAVGGEQSKPIVLLDTSVIIDGRIADICRTGFIQGELVVPLFVLNELQHIADSSDTLRRNRGRRGLEILRQLQDDSPVPVRLTDAEVRGVREVDDKLIALAKELGGAILTNDYNLNRVAELQAVKVLNVNELANAVKTVLLPGESFNLQVFQEGKEQNQGVGYLDDGTMVVVEDGMRYIGKTIEVTVSKILQTAAGRMIFARPVVEE